MNIDVRKVILNLIIPHWRQNRLVAWLYALSAPLRILYTDLCRFRDDIEYKVRYNGQVCHLTKVLNDRFDPDQHQIQIIDAGGMDLLYACPAIALGDELYTDFYVADSSYYSSYSGYDFIVIVPGGLVLPTEEGELEALTNYYKLAGKTARIIYL